ncbi:MAG TPA: hypothetical protein VH107_08325 [Lacipirellulaceae bacterium]|nr:hypothetical protein [Lacipirellulaceae bacterium]
MRTGPHEFRLVDNVSSANFKLSGSDRYLLELLGECSSIEEVVFSFQTKFRRPLAAESVREFIGQLSDLGLLSVGGYASASLAKAPVVSSPESTEITNPPDTARVNLFFDVLTLLFGWLLHPVWLIAAAPTILLAIVLIIRRWNAFYYESLMLWSTHPMIPLLAASYLQTVFFETLPRSLMMGICCRKYGGRVRKFGLEYGKWVLPTVAFSTDIGESMILMGRRGRWTLIATGVLVPLFLGAAYVIAWATASRGNQLYLFWMLMIAPSALMIVFQSNIFSLNATTHWGLAWAVDDWQLHSRALDETNAWLAGRRSPLALTPRERLWLRVYGLCSLTLRVTIDLVLFFGGGYFFMHVFGSPGAIAFLFMAGWWNRDHLKAVWRWTGYTPFEAWQNFRQWRNRRVGRNTVLTNDADLTLTR